MKIIRYCLLVVILFFVISVNVYAETYKTNSLIPVDTKATVETDKFDYKDFYYDSVVNAKGFANLRFGTIQNNTLSKTAVSINVLLFDEQKKNIGYLTYCSDKDISSDYAGFKLRANQAAPFNILVTTRYFVKDKLPRDVRFIAVKDENRYCQIGGYSNYDGLTIEEILEGPKKEEGPKLPTLNKDIFKYIIYILILIGVAIGAVILVKLVMKKIQITKEVKENKEVKEKTIDLSYNDVSDKALDLENSQDSVSSGGLVESSKESEIEDTVESTNAMMDNLYESINQSTPEENNNSSIQDLYNSINDNQEPNTNSIQELYGQENAISEQNIEQKEEENNPVDDLYDSINQDDDDENIDD